MDTCTDNEWGARHRGNLAGLNAGQATRIEMTDEATGMVKNSLRINYDRQGNFRQVTRAGEEAGYKGEGVCSCRAYASSLLTPQCRNHRVDQLIVEFRADCWVHQLEHRRRGKLSGSKRSTANSRRTCFVWGADTLAIRFTVFYEVFVHLTRQATRLSTSAPRDLYLVGCNPWLFGPSTNPRLYVQSLVKALHNN